MGTKADPARDDIRVDGRRIKPAGRLRYILLYKPAGYVTTRSDPERRRTVIDLLSGVKEYVYPVGRLDYDTEGLLLLTNDGDLAARLTHPRHGVERTYEARVAGMPDDDALDRLRRGIPLDGRRTLPAEVSLLNRGRNDREGVLSITIREGRNRQVRRMCEAVGHPVRKLIRVGIGPLSDQGLRPGEWRELTAQELRVLKQTAAWEAPKPAKKKGRGRGPHAGRLTQVACDSRRRAGIRRSMGRNRAVARRAPLARASDAGRHRGPSGDRSSDRGRPSRACAARAASVVRSRRVAGSRARPQRPVNALFSAAVDIQALCATQGWTCCVIGGLAVQRWGEPLDLKGDHNAEPRLLNLLSKHPIK